MKKNFTKKIFFVLLSLNVFSSNAQEIISVAGTNYSNNNIDFNFTIGELLIETYNQDFFLTQGFHQPLVVEEVLATPEDLRFQVDVTLYPNPVGTFLKLDVAEFKGLQYQLIDLNGRLLVASALSSRTTTIDVANLIPGIYQLRLMDGNSRKSKRYSIIKK